jgi:hypothetical protein
LANVGVTGARPDVAFGVGEFSAQSAGRAAVFAEHRLVRGSEPAEVAESPAVCD